MPLITLIRRTTLDFKAIRKAIADSLKQSRYVRTFGKKINETGVLICGDCYGISIPGAIRKTTMKNYSTCKYIITDDVLPEWFIKKNGQVIISFGKYEHNCNFDKARRSYLLSDYIVFGNSVEFAETFRLYGIYNGTILEDRNAVFSIFNGLVPEGRRVGDGQDRIVIYSGSLKQNGLTSSLLNILSQLDDDELKKCVLTFRSDSIDDDSYNIEEVRRFVDLIPMQGKNMFTFTELLSYYLYFRKDFDSDFVIKRLDRLYKREWKRLFGYIKVGCAVHFTGYEYGMINLFRCFDGRKVIFVHNNMPEEIKTRGNQHEFTLKRAYNEFTYVALVTEDMRKPTMKISESMGENFVVVPNCHDFKSVIARADYPLEYDIDTQSNVNIKELSDILDSDKMKFITIGRFSPEKAHGRLIKAFERFCTQYPESVLIIIGGRGELYEETLETANKSGAKVVVIKSMRNPMPVLKKCDLFMLPSRYEGLGLVLLEADTLGLPVFATDVEGPRGFMRENGGLLVPDTSEGILDGMMLFAQGRIPPMNIDYSVYNKKAADMFRKVTGVKL